MVKLKRTGLKNLATLYTEHSFFSFQKNNYEPHPTILSLGWNTTSNFVYLQARVRTMRQQSVQTL